MPDYQTMYFRLFRKVTNAIDLLQQAQQEGEESYLEEGSVSIVRFEPEEPRSTDQSQQREPHDEKD